ncbi:sulfate transporter/carbonic anhydrase, putative [Mycobacteroides abscessus]|nr:sulfate transporter/carbonic anhydrase, putative [Mycobacteroides abscessus]
MTTSVTEQTAKPSLLQNLRHDLPASLVVFLVALHFRWASRSPPVPR